MNRPLVSIIIPIYRVEAYLRTCLDSILQQTYQNLEIICVNDGSPDACGEILKSYAARDKRIQVIEQANQGVAIARNVGLSAAHGEYLGFVDPDDWIEPDMYETMVEAMESSQTDLAACSTTVTYQGKSYLDPGYFNMTLSGAVPINAAFMERMDVSNWNKLFRRSILEQYAIRYPANLIFEDCLFFWHYAMRCATTYCIPKRLYHYMCPPRGTMYSTFCGKNPKVLDALEVCRRLGEFLQTNNLLPAYATPFFLLSWDHYTLTQLSKQRSIRKEGRIIAATILKEYDFMSLVSQLPPRHSMIWNHMATLTKGNMAQIIHSVRNFIYFDQTKKNVRRIKICGIRVSKKKCKDTP